MTNETMCILILIALCVTILVYLLWRIKKDGLRQVVIELIVMAEAEYGSGKGEEKLEYVIEKFVGLIPMPFSLFITCNSVKKFVQYTFNSVKMALDYREPVDRENP